MSAIIFGVIILALAGGICGLAAILTGFYNGNDYTFPLFDRSREPKNIDAELDRIYRQYRG